MPTSSDVLKRILVIDDSIDARILLEKFFRAAYPWAEVRLYDPVEEGRPDADFDWGYYDLLVLDFDLGMGENGLDWLGAARAQGDVPATILLTGHGSEELVVRAFKSGVHEYLSKLQLKAARLKESVSAALAAHARELEHTNHTAYRRSSLNKSSFYRRLTLAVDDVKSGSLAALFLVRVKEFADLQTRMGLLESDVLSASIADAVYKACGQYHETASVTRIGDGTAAALVLGIHDIEAARAQADALCRAAAAVQPDGNSVQFTVSVGVVVITGGTTNQSGDAWLERVDAACRVAARKNSSAFHIDVDSGSGPRGDANAASFDITEAINKDRVQVHYQGLVSVSERASVLDSEFYQMQSQLVDTTGQVHAHSVVANARNGERLLDRWMLRKAFGQLSARGTGDTGQTGLLIPLSQETLYDKDFFDWIGALTKHIGRPEFAASIVFEISVNTVLAEYAKAVTIVGCLREIYGLSFALCNVSNAALYERCTSKTSFEFVRLGCKGVERVGAAGLAEFTELVVAANTSGALTVGEQIASAAQLTLAVQSGVDYVQGDFIQAAQDEITDDAGTDEFAT